MNDNQKGVIAFVVLLVLALLALGLVRAHARDLDGRYAQSVSIAVIASICLDRCQDVAKEKGRARLSRLAPMRPRHATESVMAPVLHLDPVL